MYIRHQGILEERELKTIWYNNLIKQNVFPYKKFGIYEVPKVVLKLMTVYWHENYEDMKKEERRKKKEKRKEQKRKKQKPNGR